MSLVDADWPEMKCLGGLPPGSALAKPPNTVGSSFALGPATKVFAKSKCSDDRWQCPSHTMEKQVRAYRHPDAWGFFLPLQQFKHLMSPGRASDARNIKIRKTSRHSRRHEAPSHCVLRLGLGCSCRCSRCRLCAWQHHAQQATL